MDIHISKQFKKTSFHLAQPTSHASVEVVCPYLIKSD
jgi:hypothetical protein